MRFDISMNYVIFMTVAKGFQYLPHVVAARNKYAQDLTKTNKSHSVPAMKRIPA
jgi:hypothetical protein